MTENHPFEFKKPELFKDKENKKWFISYKIKYPDKDKTFVRQKEYGKGLNREPDLKKRQVNASKLLTTVHNLLKKGIDPKNKNTVSELIERQKKELAKYSFDDLYKFYCKLKGFINPDPKQSKSASNVKRFLNNRLKPFLEENNLTQDLRKVTKGHIIEFLNTYYFHEDEKKRWNNTSYNNSKQWTAWFFSSLIAEDKLQMVNPCDTITSKPSKGAKRYQVYSKEELEILFNHLHETNYNLKVLCMTMYYAYIRESELERIKVSSVDLDARMIRMQAEDSKGQTDGQERDVVIAKELLVELRKHLTQNPCEPTDYLFGKRFFPTHVRVGAGWQVNFRECLSELRGLHPDKFNRPGLTLYSLKHSGVTHLIADNIKANGSLKTLRFVQAQCRHEEFRTTEKYIGKLPVDIGEYDEFVYAGY